MPSTLRILGQTWAVEPTAMDPDTRRVGHTSLSKLRMEIDDTMAPDQVRDTMLHEVIHACLFAIGAGSREKVIRPLAPVLLDALRSNPDLVSFLMEQP